MYLTIYIFFLRNLYSSVSSDSVIFFIEFMFGASSQKLPTSTLSSLPLPPLSIYLSSLSLSISLSFYLSSLSPSLSPHPPFLSFSLSIYLAHYLFLYLSVSLSQFFYLCLSLSISISLSLSLSISISLYLYVSISIHLCILSCFLPFFLSLLTLFHF